MPTKSERLSVSVGYMEKPSVTATPPSAATPASTNAVRRCAGSLWGSVREKSQIASTSFAMELAETSGPSKYIRCSRRGSS